MNVIFPFQPVYLFFHMKPGKGNSEQQEQSSEFSTTKLPSPLEYRHSLSINGEIIEGVDFTSENVDLSFINIHDFATFENEVKLIPEFKDSIQKKKTLESQVGSGNSNLLSVAKPVVGRNRSFQEIARDVITMERVLLKWPRRPADRHHSSSSEDFTLDECSGLNDSKDGSSDKDVFAESEAVESGGVTAKHVVVADQKDDNIKEANNNEDSAVQIPEHSHLNYDLFDANIKLEPSKEPELSSEPPFTAFAEGEWLIGCGNGNQGAGDVVVLSDHSGCVHVDSPASPPSSTPQPAAGQSSKGLLQSGKALSAPSSSSSGCCSCVVL